LVFEGGGVPARRGFAASLFAETFFDFVLLVFCIARIVAQVWGAGSMVVISAAVFSDFNGNEQTLRFDCI
jgi:hypothetical protein